MEKKSLLKFLNEVLDDYNSLVIEKQLDSKLYGSKNQLDLKHTAEEQAIYYERKAEDFERIIKFIYGKGWAFDEIR